MMYRDGCDCNDAVVDAATHLLTAVGYRIQKTVVHVQ